MAEIALPVLFAVFVWWFSTGLVLLLDGLPRTTFRWSLVVSSALALLAFVGLGQSARVDSVAAAYCAFSCALLIWGWHELSFLTGWVTGPRKTASLPGVRGWRRLREAVAAILWHELGILASFALVIALTWGQPNQAGAWTFAVLWAMRTSAKLNLFLGVRNLSEEFLPPHLAYLHTFFRRRAINLLFPFAVAAATVVAVLMALAALDPTTAASARAGLWLATAMLALGIVEHWFLVLPLPATALWRWAMRRDTIDKEAAIHAR